MNAVEANKAKRLQPLRPSIEPLQPIRPELPLELANTTHLTKDPQNT
jgi:hypothetical protein